VSDHNKNGTQYVEGSIDSDLKNKPGTTVVTLKLRIPF